MTKLTICEHVHLSDNRESLCDAENIFLSVDVGNRERLCGGKSGFRA